MVAPGLRLSWSMAYVAAPAAYSVVLLAAGGTLGALAYFFVVLASAGFLLRWMRQVALPLEHVGLARRFGWRDLLFGIGGFLAAGSLFQVFDAGFQALGSSMFWGTEAPRPDALPPILLGAYYVGVLFAVPFAEEVWFRGYLMGLLREHDVAPWLRIGFSSVAFGVVHLYGGPGFAAFILVWSIVAGLLYHWTDALWAPLIMHVLNNVFAHVVVPLALAD